MKWFAEMFLKSLEIPGIPNNNNNNNHEYYYYYYYDWDAIMVQEKVAKNLERYQN